jgi:NlpC/P60 family putative phage cell wall peptidase
MRLENEARRDVVAIARTWIGTPFHDCASVKGAGVDCAQLVKAVYIEAGLMAPFDLPHYSPQWFLHQEGEAFLSHVSQRCVEIAAQQARLGDIVLYRFGRCYAHAGIVAEPGFPRIIHAYKQARCVVAGEGDQGDLAVIAETGKPRPRIFFTLKSWYPDVSA